MEGERSSMSSLLGIIAILLYDILYIGSFIRLKTKNKKEYINLIILMVLSAIILYSLINSLSA